MLFSPFDVVIQCFWFSTSGVAVLFRGAEFEVFCFRCYAVNRVVCAGDIEIHVVIVGSACASVLLVSYVSTAGVMTDMMKSFKMEAQVKRYRETPRYHRDYS